MYFDLLIKTPFKGYSLNDFTSDMLTLVRSDQWEHRQNDGKDGYYFRAVVMGVAVTVSTASDEGFSDYSFGIRFESELPYKGERLSFEGLADCLARKLAVDGYDVVRPRRRETGYDGIRYLLNPDKNDTLRKPVLTEEVDCTSTSQYALSLPLSGSR